MRQRYIVYFYSLIYFKFYIMQLTLHRMKSNVISNIAEYKTYKMITNCIKSINILLSREYCKLPRLILFFLKWSVCSCWGNSWRMCVSSHWICNGYISYTVYMLVRCPLKQIKIVYLDSFAIKSFIH